MTDLSTGDIYDLVEDALLALPTEKTEEEIKAMSSDEKVCFLNQWCLYHSHALKTNYGQIADSSKRYYQRVFSKDNS